VERAAELDEKIERTDDLIDEIVYELYGLTDEEIEIVEETVGG
jgi:type II restriction/modification system DNA methylase subunit YeeA